MPLFESNNHPNANGSKIFSFITIATFIIGFFLPVIFHHGIHFLAEALLAVATVVTAIVGFKNTFETNDPWKTVVQGASCFLNIIVPAIFIAITNNG